MTFLVDTNVWLELLLDQARAEEAVEFFQTVETKDLMITDFALYSIGIILCRLRREVLYRRFLSDVLEDSALRVLRLETDDLLMLLEERERLGFDFDDAYQYTAAKKHGCTLISFDSHFDRVPGIKKTPGEAIQR